MSTERILSHSKVVRISEELAKQLTSAHTPKSQRVVIVPDLPVARDQEFRNDGLYVDRELFSELQQQQVALEVRHRELKEALEQRFEPFRQPNHNLLPPAKAEPTLQLLLDCLKSHPGRPLKCHPHAVAFASAVRAASETDAKL
ncbi:uncharacterized protein LOC132199026 [Neocloeon triangulifer]|uniref:uncharacterized protein LOC132199026 n=1 Tax=Neocloeon triangulifer TaxID=2078957 RepID=UPI00286EBAA6|nr:uncharacterized protein LOC132199026 [Neocloeon triangulifer]